MRLYRYGTENQAGPLYIRELRIKAGFTQEQVAAKLQVQGINMGKLGLQFAIRFSQRIFDMLHPFQ